MMIDLNQIEQEQIYTAMAVNFVTSTREFLRTIGYSRLETKSKPLSEWFACLNSKLECVRIAGESEAQNRTESEQEEFDQSIIKALSETAALCCVAIESKLVFDGDNNGAGS